jgi:hypothetical protein
VGLTELLAAAVTALATCVLAVAAWIQLPLISRQVSALADQIRLSREAEANAERRTREWETLKACQHYDSDPVLDAATQRIWIASAKGTDYRNSAVDRRDVCLLNYLDGLATGIEQGLYIEAVIRDHLSSVFDHAVVNFVNTQIVDGAGLETLLAVHARWFRTSPPSGYQSASGT